MLPHTEADVPPGIGELLEIMGRLDQGLVGRRQVGGAAHQGRGLFGDGVEHLSGGGPGRHGAVRRLEIGNVFIPALFQGPGLGFFPVPGQPRVFFLEFIEPLLPIGLFQGPRLDAFSIGYQRIIGHAETEFLVAAQIAFGEPDLLHPQRRAVGVRGALLVGAAVSDMGAQDDDGGHLRFGLGRFQGRENGGHIVAVHHREHMPAHGLEPKPHILGKADVGASLDGDLVVVVNADQLSQPQVAGQRGRFIRDTFHEIAVAAHDIGVMIHDFLSHPVESGGQVAFGHGHAHGGGKPLSQRAGGGFHAGGDAVFGVARGFAVQLTKLLNILGAQVVTGQGQQAVEQHRGVSPGEDEPVPVGPLGIFGVVFHHLGPQHIGGRGQPQRGAGVAGFGLLNGVHGQGADNVDTGGVFHCPGGRQVVAHG